MPYAIPRTRRVFPAARCLCWSGVVVWKNRRKDEGVWLLLCPVYKVCRCVRVGMVYEVVGNDVPPLDDDIKVSGCLCEDKLVQVCQSTCEIAPRVRGHPLCPIHDFAGCSLDFTFS